MSKRVNYTLAIAAMISLSSISLYADYTQITNIPTLYIETENGVAITSKENYVKATMHYVDASGDKEYTGLNIRGRGNSTWGLEKKPYRLKFDKKQRLLGSEYANAKSWTLLANHADKTLIRNAVASYIGSFAGQPFTAAAVFVDLVLNDEYLGNYQISDQIEVREKRVDITEQSEAITDDSDITGGYLLEVDGFGESEPAHFTTDRGVIITIKSPDDDIIDDRQITYIKDFINQFEAALFSEDFKDPEKGYRKYVDPSTLASWYIASELTGNVDCFWSTYIYKKRGDDKIYWGPMWDYDIAFNNCDRVGDVSKSLMSDVAFSDNLSKMWIKRMWQDPWFASLIGDTWKALVDKGIEQHIIEYIDMLAAEIEESQEINFAIWPIDVHVYNELVLFSTYAEGVEYLKNFIHTHCAYLSQAFEMVEPTPDFVPDFNYCYSIENYGTKLVADVNDGLVVLNSRNTESNTQKWYFKPIDNMWYIIINDDNGLAIIDRASYGTDAYQVGYQLGLSAIDESNYAQQWHLSPLLTGNRYVIENRLTSLAWNNSGNSTADGTSAISWNNDNQNSNKTTRQWTMVKDDLRVPDGIKNINAPDYSVTFTKDNEMLHFCTPDRSIFEGGVVAIYSVSGNLVAVKDIAADVDLSSLPAGIYIVKWSAGSILGTSKIVL
jgi:hypothetical protein